MYPILFTQVCRILASAGYDIHTTDPTLPGLHVHDHGDTVTISWHPTPDQPPPHHAPNDTPGLHDAIRAALTSLLADAGLNTTPDTETGTLHITRR